MTTAGATCTFVRPHRQRRRIGAALAAAALLGAPLASEQVGDRRKGTARLGLRQRQDLLGLGVIERIVPEPIGGAHRHPAETIAALGAALSEELEALAPLSPAEARAARREKFLRLA